MQNKVPVTIFTGFLGSGKTTLINRLISLHPTKKIGIIINEFGEVGVDSMLVQTSEELKIEVSNGCACCVVRGDLELAVNKMLTQISDLDYLFIEASGLAEPNPIVQTFVHNLALNKRSYLDCVVCTIDCVNFVSDWETFETLRNQIANSDFVVLTKSSESAENKEKITALLKQINPDMAIIDSDQTSSDSELKLLLDSHSFDLSDLEMELIEEEKHHHQTHHKSHAHLEESHEHHHEHEEFDEVIFRSNKPLDPNKLDQVFQSETMIPVIRSKGFLNLSHNSQISFVFQLVGHGRQLSPFSERKNESVIVLIGKHLNKDMILNLLESTKVD